MKEEKSCEVKKIVLKIDDKEVSLTPEQVKKLKELLNDLFGKEIIKVVTQEIHHDHYNYPIWRYYEPPYIPNGTVVYCSSY